MSIWIRSQDGGLGEYNKILPPAIAYKMIPDPEGSPFDVPSSEILHVNVLGFYLASRLDVLGVYPNEAEALKVLDMIQDHIETQRGNYLGSFYYKDSGDPRPGAYDHYVFQVPAAGFSEEGK